jgi:hypothetical protein
MFPYVVFLKSFRGCKGILRTFALRHYAAKRQWGAYALCSAATHFFGQPEGDRTMRNKKMISLACCALALTMTTQPVWAAEMDLDGGTSVSLNLYKDVPAPSAGASQALGTVNFLGNDAASTRTLYSSIRARQESATSGSLELITVRDNAPETTVKVSPGQLEVAGNVQASGTVSGNGSGLANLNASNISSGVLPLDRLPDSLQGKTATHALSADTATTCSMALSGATLYTTSGTLNAGNFVTIAHATDPGFRRDANFFKISNPYGCLHHFQSSTTTFDDIDSTGEATLTGSDASNTYQAGPYAGVTAYFPSFTGSNTNQYLNLDGSSMSLGAGDFTVDFWMYLNATPTANRMIFRMAPYGTARATTSPLLFVTSSKQLALFSTVTTLSGSTVLSLSRWYHIAIVRNSGVIKLYVNGVSESDTWSNASAISGTGACFGADVSGKYSANFLFTEFRSVPGTAIWTSSFTPPTAPYTTPSNIYSPVPLNSVSVDYKDGTLSNSGYATHTTFTNNSGDAMRYCAQVKLF